MPEGAEVPRVMGRKIPAGAHISKTEGQCMGNPLESFPPPDRLPACLKEQPDPGPAGLGEPVLHVALTENVPSPVSPMPDAVEALIRAGTRRMDAIKEVARRRGLSKREVYNRLLAAKE